MWKWLHSGHWDKSDIWRIKPSYKHVEGQKHIGQHLHTSAAMAKEGLVILLCWKTKHLLSSFKDTAKPGGIQFQVFKCGPDFLVYRRNQDRTGWRTLGFDEVGNGAGTTLPISKPLLPSRLHHGTWKTIISLGVNLTNVLLVCLSQFLIKSNQHFRCFHNAWKMHP